MKTIKLLLSISMVLFLSACGGSSSSGGGGGNNQFAGTYSGNHTVNFSAGGTNTSDVVFLTLTVNGDGSYRIVDGDGGAGTVPAVGTLAGNRFDATGTGTGTVDGITCNMRSRYSGTIANNRAVGSTSGSATCNVSGTNVNVSFSGRFDLPKTGNARAPRNGSIMSKTAPLFQ